MVSTSRLGVFASVLAGSLTFGGAAAALTQPNGTVIPTPLGCEGNRPAGLLASLACVCATPGTCNIGAPCASPTSCDDGQHASCETTLWHSFNDNTCIPSNHSGLDPVLEAATTPETFHPTCGLTFTLVTRGAAQFKNVFGWYNASGAKPAIADLHPMLGCADGDGKKVVLDITKEPAYAGGNVGFFLMTPEAHGGSKQCAGGNCCPTAARVAAGEGYVYFSEKAWNPDQAGSGSFIHLLVLDSHLVQRKFYFAWEDIYGGSDNEFTDLVTSVEGVECAGGGEACETGKKGVCGPGVTVCAGGSVGCTSLAEPSAEVCNGLDDDCDGAVDDAATCPGADAICQNGKCVHRCGGGEFKCAPGAACDPKTGYCVEPACVGVTCEGETMCRGGVCGVPCNGVVCPHGQTCEGDRCVDKCRGVVCPGGEVCRAGVCFGGCATCDGVVCGAPLACVAASGECVDPSCAGGCPTGTFCRGGACVDACSGVVCPGGEACVKGECGGTGGLDGPDGGLSPVGTDAPFADGGAGSSDDFDVAARGCACAEARDTTGGGAAAIALALAAIGITKGRRARPRAGGRASRGS
jgi:hypothetical protein